MLLAWVCIRIVIAVIITDTDTQFLYRKTVYNYKYVLAMSVFVVVAENDPLKFKPNPDNLVSKVGTVAVG